MQKMQIYHGAQSQEIEELKEEGRSELLGSSVDSLPRRRSLQNLYDAYSNNFCNIEDDDLYHVAIRFRLLIKTAWI